jgi:uncharacterized protein (DUF2267 family)
MKVMLDIFGKTIKKTSLWLEELEDRIGWTDTQKTYLALRSVLHALRDRWCLMKRFIWDAVAYADPRFYYEGWKLPKTTQERHLEAILAHIQNDFDRRSGIRVDCHSVFALLSTK